MWGNSIAEEIPWHFFAPTWNHYINIKHTYRRYCTVGRFWPVHLGNRWWHEHQKAVFFISHFHLGPALSEYFPSDPTCFHIHHPAAVMQLLVWTALIICPWWCVREPSPKSACFIASIKLILFVLLFARLIYLRDLCLYLNFFFITAQHMTETLTDTEEVIFTETEKNRKWMKSKTICYCCPSLHK